VTVKFSKEFYDKLGHEIVRELVDWFNQVDATYRADLKEFNELNFARFDAKVEQRFAGSDAKLERRLAEMDTRWEQRITRLEKDLIEQISRCRSDLIKWTFVFIAASTTMILGTLIAILQLAL
jgi:CRP-like cAMP-binding protein